MASVAAAYPLRVQPQTDTKYADVKESISMPSIRTVLWRRPTRAWNRCQRSRGNYCPTSQGLIYAGNDPDNDTGVDEDHL